MKSCDVFFLPDANKDYGQTRVQNFCFVVSLFRLFRLFRAKQRNSETAILVFQAKHRNSETVVAEKTKQRNSFVVSL